MPSSLNLSYLDLVNRADNFHLYPPKPSAEALVPFLLSPSYSAYSPIGLIRPSVLLELQKDKEWRKSRGLKEIWDIQLAPLARRSYVAFAPSCNTPAKRARAMKETCTRWRDSGIFPDIIGPSKWRSEWYDVYRTPFGALRVGGGDPMEYQGGEKEENYAFSMERSACALFGVVTFGVHLSVYEENEDGIRMWIPRRAKTKPTCVLTYFLSTSYAFPSFRILIISISQTDGRATSTTASPAVFLVVSPRTKALSRKRWKKLACRRTWCTNISRLRVVSATFIRPTGGGCSRK